MVYGFGGDPPSRRLWAGCLAGGRAESDAAVRERDTEGILAHHDTVIAPDDRVIMFVSNKRMIPKVEKLFQVGFGFV